MPGTAEQAKQPQQVPTLSHLYFDPSRDAQQRGTLCVMALLSWVAACDGIVAEGEQELLARVFDAADEPADLRMMLQIAKRADLDDLELACRHVQRKLGRARKRLLLELAIAIAFQDAALSTSENHLLQFLADLLGVRPRSFLKLYQSLTGQTFPVPGDLSSAAWWEQRDAGHAPVVEWQLPEETKAIPDITTASAPPPPSRTEALRLLGLSEGATLDAIHAAYRRAAKRRHPDRFVNLGPAAVAVATEAFQRVSQAHEMLAGAVP